MSKIKENLYDIFRADKDNRVLYQLVGYENDGLSMNLGLFESEEKAFEVQKELQNNPDYDNFYIKLYGLELYKDSYFDKL